MCQVVQQQAFVYGMASDACLLPPNPLELKYYVLAAVHDIHGQSAWYVARVYTLSVPTYIHTLL